MDVFLDAVVVVTAMMWITVLALLALFPRAPRWVCVAILVAGGVTGGLLAQTLWRTRDVLVPTGVAVGVTAALAIAYFLCRSTVTPVGATFWVSWLGFGLVTLAWGVVFMAHLSLSPMSEGLVWSALVVSGATLPSAVVTTREGWEPLLTGGRRPSPPRDIPMTRSSPRVSIHVPCHAEPPDLVISTLDRLAELEYDNYEVLVVDNNTTDPDLWRPVREHCRMLGERYRFFHVEGITGAKAGALNWVLPHTDPDAVLVAVVDADYHVESQWLRETVGYFANPRMGFVQCPHAYRDYAGSRFTTWANWEYAVFFQTGMVSLDAGGAGLTVGTMSLIRKRALLDAGGWAEWCLTEDSELAIRIHAAGYGSVYLTEPYGRGLVPETFEGYRRQRFRWTFGPVQEFRRHWRQFLPTWLGGRPNRLTARQKLHHANHGLDVIGIGLRMLTLVLGAAAGISMSVHYEHVPMPVELFISSTSVLVGSVTMRLLVYRRAVGANLAQTLGGIVGFAALSLVITIASIRATVGLSSAWHRTNKFRVNSNWRNALAAATGETSAALACIATSIALFVWSPSGIVVMLAIAVLAQAITFLAAPLLALIADQDLRTTSVAMRPKQAVAEAIGTPR